MSDVAADAPRPAYERSDVSARLIALIALGLFVTLCAVPVLLLALFPSTVSDQPKLPGPTPPAPRLQIDPTADLNALRAREEARLGSYGWIDREQGIVRIPIDEAMRRIVATGIADWPGAKP